MKHCIRVWPRPKQTNSCSRKGKDAGKDIVGFGNCIFFNRGQHLKLWFKLPPHFERTLFTICRHDSLCFPVLCSSHYASGAFTTVLTELPAKQKSAWCMHHLSLRVNPSYSLLHVIPELFPVFPFRATCHSEGAVGDRRIPSSSTP